MNNADEAQTTSVRWDLSTLFSSPEDPKIDETWKKCLERAETFASTYRGKLNSPDLTAKLLVSAIKEVESIYQEVTKPIYYAELLFTCDSNSHEIGSFMQKQLEKMTQINVLLMFYELELQKIPEAIITSIINDPCLENYRHHIKVARSMSQYRLTEPEEIVLEETANTGNRAWIRLFEEVTSNYTYRYHNPETGALESLCQAEILKLFRSPDRKVRQAAADSLSQGLQDLQRVLCFIYNNLINDKKVEDRLRKLEFAEQSRHLSNELDKPTVDLVMGMCRDHYNMVSRFYTIKREILGLDELTHIDRYAPLFEAKEHISFEKGREIILTAFGRFSETMKEHAQAFFDNNWIDAESRPGKHAGAFCAYVTPDKNPFVFVNYLNRPDCVGTLAHELGHGVHASLSRCRSFFNFHGTLPMAELASTFGEMLVFEDLVATASLKDKIALYADKIENVFANVFRQAAMFRFEQRCHEWVRENGELAPQQFGDFWQEEIQSMFGDSLKLGEQHRSWWSYVNHFISVPFYVYAYSFGELLALSLYEMAKKSGTEFTTRYLDLLKLGGSRSPQELMAAVEVDLKDPAFWKGGFNALEKLIAEFERLWAEYNEKG